MTLQEKLEKRTATLGVVGLGYVGLSLALEFARAGYRVIGVDTDGEKVERLRAGESYILDIPSERVRKAVHGGGLEPSMDHDRLVEMDSVHICVQTPWRAKTNKPDLSHILQAVEEVRQRLRPGQLIVLESTTYPGTTSRVIRPLLEESGLRVGRDFFLVFSPERVDPGNKDYTIRNIPKIVGGVTPECTQLAEILYRNCLETVVPVSSADVAEMAKLLENTFRSVNIGFVNEFALLCEKVGIDVWEVIDAASTKPFGFMTFYPGPGLGGHCIPVDPLYLSWAARVNGFHPRLIDVAVQINREMPAHVVRRVREALEGRGKSLEGSHVLVVGVAYKRDTGDVRESPAVEVIQLLEEKGVRVTFTDPHVPTLQANGTRLESHPLSPQLVRAVDCVLILTDHSDLDYDVLAGNAEVVVDTRNALKNLRGEHILRL
jgi:UDP-N-acetyl-D-glucosamine dehydrogenase